VTARPPAFIQYRLKSLEDQALAKVQLASLTSEVYFYIPNEAFNTGRNGPPAIDKKIYLFFVLAPEEGISPLTVQTHSAILMLIKSLDTGPAFILPDSLEERRESPTWPLHLAKGWLEDCIKTYPKCSLEKPTWLPTRLLELDAPEDGRIRLIHTQHTEGGLVNEPYMTLSHCWGKTDIVKLTAESLSKLSTGIEVSILPQTFQDAVKVASTLGVKYLSIDSLCIF
jgi:Heterokaryon incompatibility protein (HET)